MPAWLFCYRHAEWVEGCSPGSPDPDSLGRPFMGAVEVYEAGRRRWRAAAEVWLVERDLFMWGHRVPDGGWQALQELRKAEPWRVVADHGRGDGDEMRERASLVMAAYTGASRTGDSHG